MNSLPLQTAMPTKQNVEVLSISYVIYGSTILAYARMNKISNEPDQSQQVVLRP